MNFTKRRQALQAKASDNVAMFIPAATIVQRSNDTTHPFSQDRNFYYLTGVDDPDCLLMLAPQHPNKDLREVLFIPDFSEFKATWDDAQIDEDTTTKISGISTILRNSSRLDVVREALDWADSVYTPRAETSHQLDMMSTSTEPKLRQWLKRHGAKELRDITPEITKLRMIKDKDELSALSTCVDVTHEAFDALSPLLRPGSYDYELEAVAYSAIRRRNYKWGYDPIFASGSNTCVLHSMGNDSNIQNNSPVLIDIGASYNYYGADITRSYWVGEPNSEYERLHAVVSNLQQFVTDMIQPGKTIYDVSSSFREALLEQLKLLGLLDSGADLRDTLEFMPHGIGHHLGLDTHDPADYKTPLQPGMVLTVEPGIYLKEQGVGIRIEDDVVVTGTGCKILGSNE